MVRIQASPSSTGTPRSTTPPPREKVEADFDVLAQRYDATLGRAKSPRLVSLVNSLQPPRTARFLDIGCGGGRLVARMAASYAEVWGIDISSQMLRVAREMTRQLANVALARMDGQRLGFADATFDYVVCSNVLHHLDPAATIQEITRVLRPGGRLLVVDDIAPTDPAGRRQEPRRWFDPRRWPREIALLLNLIRQFGPQDAIRVYRFLKSGAWRRHMARDRLPSLAEFASALSAALPGSVIGRNLQSEAYAVWDMPESARSIAREAE